ncbi:MAG: site-2 protease family protein [Polyangia bacterium]
MSDPSTTVRNAVMYLVALVLSVCVHEYGHALLADKLGDPLPRAQGRVTLNPLAHIDLIGTIAFPLAGFFLSASGSVLGAYVVGWGKPVQVSLSARHMTRRFETRTSHMFIALAGPCMNILFATLISGLYVGLVRVGAEIEMANALLPVVAMNIGLAFFNLIPCPPLDGGAVLRGLLPRSMDYISDFLDRYGYVIFIALLVTQALRYILYPAAVLASLWQRELIALAFGHG